MTQYKEERNLNGNKNRQINTMELRRRRQRMQRKKQKRRILISAIAEILILSVLAVVFCWNQ